MNTYCLNTEKNTVTVKINGAKRREYMIAAKLKATALTVLELIHKQHAALLQYHDHTYRQHQLDSCITEVWTCGHDYCHQLT